MVRVRVGVGVRVKGRYLHEHVPEAEVLRHMVDEDRVVRSGGRTVPALARLLDDA
jgi:hypothetical protein